MSESIVLSVRLVNANPTRDLRRLEVTVEGSDVASIDFTPDRWVGDACSPILLPIPNDIRSAFVELWSSSDLSASTSGAKLSTTIAELNIGQSVTKAITWVDPANKPRCDVEITKMRMFPPNRFKSDLDFVNLDQPFDELHMFVHRAVNLDPAGAPWPRSQIRVNGVPFTTAMSGVADITKFPVWNEELVIARQGTSRKSSSVCVSMMNADADQAPPIQSWTIEGRMICPQIQYNLMVPFDTPSGLKSLYFSLIPTVSTVREEAFLGANLHLSRLRFEIESVQNCAEEHLFFVVYMQPTSIEDYARKVQESRNNWPPFPFVKVDISSSGLDSVLGEEVGIRARVIGAVHKSRFAGPIASHVLYEDQSVMFSPTANALIEVYADRPAPAIAKRFLGYTMVAIQDADSSTIPVLMLSMIQGSPITIKCSAARYRNPPIAKKAPPAIMRPFKVLRLGTKANQRPARTGEDSLILHELQDKLDISNAEVRRQQTIIGRLSADVELKMDSIRTCGLEIADLRLQIEQLKNEKRKMKVALDDAGKFEQMALDGEKDLSNRPENLDRVRGLFQQCRKQMEAERDKRVQAEARIQSLGNLVERARMTQRNFLKLNDAHSEQSLVLQGLQADSKRIDKFRKTILSQEQVIERLEALLSKGSGTSILDGPAGPDVRARGRGEEDNDEWKARALRAEARCDALQVELSNAADLYGRDITALQTTLFEKELLLSDQTESTDATRQWSMERS